MNGKTITLDVRDDIRNGREPFSRIMDTVGRLAADESLQLIAPFEPVPLFGVMAKHGFSHSAQSISADEWRILFCRTTDGSPATPSHPHSPGETSRSMTTASSSLEVDARGLEPPQPMVKILEALATLPDSAALRARTDRRPMHLYAQLEARGFTSESEEQPDGSFLTHIRRH